MAGAGRARRARALRRIPSGRAARLGALAAAGVMGGALLGAAPAQAGDDFRRGFERELGRIAARRTVHAGEHFVAAFLHAKHHRGHGHHRKHFRRHRVRRHHRGGPPGFVLRLGRGGHGFRAGHPSLRHHRIHRHGRGHDGHPRRGRRGGGHHRHHRGCGH